MNPGCRKLVLSLSLVWTGWATCVHAQDFAPVLSTGEYALVVEALGSMNMTTNDPGFEKDVAEPRLVLERVRAMLGDPFDLPRLADTILGAVTNDGWALRWEMAAGLLETGEPAQIGARGNVPDWSSAGIGPDLAACLRHAWPDLETAAGHVAAAFDGLAASEMVYAAGSLAAGAFNLEDFRELEPVLVAAGIPQETVRELRDEEHEIDPEPGAERFLDVVRATRAAHLVAAAALLEQAANGCLLACEMLDPATWPDRPLRIETALGDVWIGTTNADIYSAAAVLIVDPGGDDRYEGAAGAANGLLGNGLALVVDLAGRDSYLGTGLAGPGTALFGAAGIMEREGDDVYRADYTGQAAGLFGAAWVRDRAGNDFYQAHGFGQAAGWAGIGFLIDDTGNDRYDVGFYGQGAAGVLGLGLLVDRRGNDRYLAGGRKPDHERHDDRTLSLAQGFSTGMRPFAGGGVGALVDLSGNDAYQADVYGQGVGYWYAAGMLLDRCGNDTYSVYHYGQGSGIHLSMGLLADGAGDDQYSGYILSQGNAHDFAVGMLLDRAGSDTYTADHFSQGRALNNSFALLLDSGGNDGYFARQNKRCQGIGHDGRDREYGSLALLVDAGGKDIYSCGARNGGRFLRPDYGIVYDRCLPRKERP